MMSGGVDVYCQLNFQRALYKQSERRRVEQNLLNLNGSGEVVSWPPSIAAEISGWKKAAEKGDYSVSSLHFRKEERNADQNYF